MKSLFELADCKRFERRIEEKRPKVDYEFQALGILLEPIYGKVIWSLFHRKGVTEEKVRRAHEIAKRRGIEKYAYLWGIIKKL